MLVYGHAGYPVIIFPTTMGRYHESKDFGLIDTASWFVEQGLIQLYCPDSIDVASGEIKTIDSGFSNLERGNSGLVWAPDSKKLAYTKGGANNFRRVMIWDSETNSIQQITNKMADALSPAWDNDRKHFYFLASTNVALGSGWANTSSITADPSYAAYVIDLQEGVDSPFIPRSDEEAVKEDKPKEEKSEKKEDKKEVPEAKGIQIDYEGIDRRTIALPMPTATYTAIAAGPKGSFFIGERKPGSFSQTVHKFTLKDRKPKEYLSGV